VRTLRREKRPAVGFAVNHWHCIEKAMQDRSATGLKKNDFSVRRESLRGHVGRISAALSGAVVTRATLRARVAYL
jgi:hypothetical protein